MKKRRLVFSLFLMASIALLSIGYASLTKTLEIAGKLNGKEDNANLVVKFDGVGNITTSGSLKYVDNPTPENKTDVEKPTYSDTMASFSVSNFKYVGDKVVFYLKITNDSANNKDLSAKLSIPVVTVNVSGETKNVEEDENSAGYNIDNIFTGDHFKITATYVETDGVVVADTNVGTIDEDGTVVLDAKETKDGKGEYIWLKVEIELHSAIVMGTDASFPIHDIKVKFTATSITRETVTPTEVE